MKKLFLVVVLISPSFLCSMDPEKKPMMPPSRSNSVPSNSKPLIPVKLSGGRSRLNSDSTSPRRDLSGSRDRLNSNPDYKKTVNAVEQFEFCRASSSSETKK